MVQNTSAPREYPHHSSSQHPKRIILPWFLHHLHYSTSLLSSTWLWFWSGAHHSLLVHVYPQTSNWQFGFEPGKLLSSQFPPGRSYLHLSSRCSKTLNQAPRRLMLWYLWDLFIASSYNLHTGHWHYAWLRVYLRTIMLKWLLNLLFVFYFGQPVLGPQHVSRVTEWSRDWA